LKKAYKTDAIREYGTTKRVKGNAENEKTGRAGIRFW
jgi:hypothetical protein